jgi:NitT/TauT family transport system substrate-binding protein
VKAGEEKGPFCYRLAFDGSRNIRARAWAERGGPAIAFARGITWHPRVVISAGHFHLGHRLPAIVAKHKGWFQEEGLHDYEITFSGDDAQTIEGMTKGTIDIALDVKPDKLLHAYAGGKRFFIIGAMRNTDPYFIVGSKDIKSMKDLRGKTIGIREPDGVGTLQIKRLLREAGLDPDRDVSWLRTGPSATRIQKPYLDRGETHACQARNYDLEPYLAEGYNILANLGDIYPDGYQSRSIAATERMTTQYPETLVCFLKGIIRAYRFMAQAKNHHELIRIIEEAGEMGASRGDDPDDFPPDLAPGYYAEILRATHPQDGTFTRRGLMLAIENEMRLGKLKAPVAADEVLKGEFVERAAAELGLR